MKVTVKDFLNVRVGKPDVNAPCYQYLAPGSVVEVEETFHLGDVYEGNNRWLKDPLDNYYWSGGVEQNDDLAKITNPFLFHVEEFWWIRNFGIGELWKKGLTGKHIKVAVVDSGIAAHEDLSVPADRVRDFSGSATGAKDHTGHGTHVTGILNARNNGAGIRGIADGAEVYAAKITNDVWGDRAAYMADAIRWAVELGVDIISISAGFKEDYPALLNAVEYAAAERILIVCAAGNRESTSHTDILFPARYRKANMLTVGGLTAAMEPLSDTINVSETDLFAPGEKVMSTFTDPPYVTLTGSSQATPFVTGVCCLLLEEKRKDGAYGALQIKDHVLSKAKTTPFGKIINPVSL